MGRPEFPIHPTVIKGKRRSVPWDFIAPHEARAIENHTHGLSVLAAIGGLSVCEIVAVIEDRPWRPMPREEMDARIEEMVKAWEARR